jgi:hypothetical protein
MADPAENFAIIPVTGKPPAGAIAHGAMAAITEQILDSVSRKAALDLLARAEAAAEEEREREQREQQVITEGIRALADSVAQTV